MTGQPLADGRDLLSQLASQAANRSGGIISGTVLYTWAEMWALSSAARDTVRHIAGPGEAVGVLLTNTPHAVATLVGALRAGRRIVSLPLPGRSADPAAYTSSLTAACVSAGVVAFICDPSHVQMFAGMFTLGVSTFDDAVVTRKSLSSDEPGELVQFTSGSTGTPKGVPLSVANLGANTAAIIERSGLNERSDVVSWLPMSHDMGLVGVTLCAWSCGSKVTLRSPEQFVTRPTIWLDDVAQTGARMSAAPNFALDIASRAIERGHRPGSLAGLRHLTIGGELIRAETLRRFASATAPFGFDSRGLAPAYGMAEATLAVTMVHPDDHWRSVHVEPTALAQGRVELSVTGVELVSCGRPIDGFVVTAGSDGSATSPVSLDGPSVFGGYVGQHARSDDFVTADVGFVSDGELVIVGRRDDVVVVRGLNIWPGDVERAAQRVPQTRPGCVAGVQDAGNLTVVAEPATSAAADGLEFAAREVRRQVSIDVGVGPRRVVWVTPGTLPKTSSGKLQRKAITARLATGTLDVISDVRWGAGR